MAENQIPPLPPAPPPPIPPPPPSNRQESDARMWNMFCHLSALAGYVIPFGNLLGPLIVWQLKKNEFPSVDLHGKAALNFQITLTLVLLAGGLASFVLWLTCLGAVLLFFLVPLLSLIGLGGLVLAIIAGIKANNGEDFKYPWSLELVK